MSRTACAVGKDIVAASFKGVPFYCTECNIQGGRRGAEGEFPFGEQTAYCDLGRKIRIWGLTAYFREDNHVGDARALFRACESPGPGILVHPTYGATVAACRSCKINDKLEEEGGQSTAEMEFVEANIGFTGILGSIFGIISSGLLATSQTSFLRDYTPIRVPQPWVRDVVDKAQHLVGATATTATRVLKPDSPSTDWRDVLNMQEVSKDDGMALSAPVVDDALVDGFAIISRNIVDPKEKFTAFRHLVNAATVTSNLPAGAATDSDEAVVSRHRLLAAVGMAEAAMGRKYKTIDECLAAMDTVMAVFEDEAKLAYAECDNKLFLEIKKYATEFAKMMHDLSYRLPSKIIVNFSGGVHPLVAAYAIYNDAKRHRELEERNIVDANGRFGMLVSGIAPT
jgi:hypothetical protein